MGVRTKTAKRLADSGGTAPQYSCRGWLRFDMTGTGGLIGTAYKNVAALVDVAVGNWQVQWTTAPGDSSSDVTYGIALTAGRNSPLVASGEAINYQITPGAGGATTPQVSPGWQTNVFCSQASAAVDLPDVCVCIFR